MEAHTINPRPVWSAQFVPGHSELHSETLSHKTNNKTKRKLLFPCGHVRWRGLLRIAGGGGSLCLYPRPPGLGFPGFGGVHGCHTFSFLALFPVQPFIFIYLFFFLFAILLFCFPANGGCAVGSATVNNNISFGIYFQII